jgi:multicomponent Na+:H+ antiporter subunit B
VISRVRLLAFLAASAVVAVLLVPALVDLPDFGAAKGPYSALVAKSAVDDTHATDAVAAVNFGYRAFDTLAEEFILFAAVTGTAIVLRQRRGEHQRAPDERGDEHHLPGASEATGALALLALPLALVLGAYVIAHGHLTPGGGFQGGVIVAAAFLIVFLGGEYAVLRRVAPHAFVEAVEAGGAAGYALIGIGGLLFAAAAFENFVALGTPGDLLSAGTIPLSNLAVGLEVAGAFVLLWTEFFDQALLVKERG